MNGDVKQTEFLGHLRRSRLAHKAGQDVPVKVAMPVFPVRRNGDGHPHWPVDRCRRKPTQPAHQPGQPVAVRVLLMIDEVSARGNLQRVGQDACAAVRSRPQPDDLRPERNRPVVAVMREMIDTCSYGHQMTLITFGW